MVQRGTTWLHKNRGARYRYRYHHLKHVLLLLSGIASRAVGPDRFLPMHELVASLSCKYMKQQEELTGILLCVYVLRGCDTFSYPCRREKKKAAAVAIDMVGSSEDFTVTEAIKAETTLVFAVLYGKRGHDCSLNTLRQHMFASSDGGCFQPAFAESSLPAYFIQGSACKEPSSPPCHRVWPSSY